MKDKAIFGFGGFASEVGAYLKSKHSDIIHFVHDEYYVKGNSKLFKISDFNPANHEMIIAIANPFVKQKVVNSLPKETKYFSFIHDSCIISDDNIFFGEGLIMCPNCVLTTDIILGNHVHLNVGTIIGHNSRISNYFTSAPSVNISGDCQIDELVYFGTNSSIKEKLSVTKKVIVGMGAKITKNIEESGTYVGIPAIKIK